MRIARSQAPLALLSFPCLWHVFICVSLTCGSCCARTGPWPLILKGKKRGAQQHPWGGCSTHPRGGGRKFRSLIRIADDACDAAGLNVFSGVISRILQGRAITYYKCSCSLKKSFFNEQLLFSHGFGLDQSYFLFYFGKNPSRVFVCFTSCLFYRLVWFLICFTCPCVFTLGIILLLYPVCVRLSCQAS